MLRRRLFITGSSGYIGRNLTEYFSAKYHLFTPPHKQLDLLKAEEVMQYIIDNKIDYVIHTANIGGARTDLDKRDIVYSNLKMFFNIVRNEQYVEKIIYFGSGSEYDKDRSLEKITEEEFDKHIPSDDYGFYKYVCSKYIIGNKSGKIINLRLFGTYGPYDNYLARPISNSILKNIFKQPIVISQNVYFDYLFIGDLLRIVEYFLDHQTKFNIYNAASGKKTDLINIIKIIYNIGSYKSKIKILNPGLNLEYTASNKRLMSEMKNFQFTPLKKGIIRLYLWYQKNLSRVDKAKIIQDEFIKYCKVRK